MDGHDMELFKLSTIKSQQHLNTLENTEMLEGEELSDEGGVADELEGVCLYHVICVCISIVFRLLWGRTE